MSDKKIGVSSNGTTIDYYNADVVTANDYYPFGMQMPGRKYSQVNSSYRYGFNGQENSDEIAAGLTTAMYWEYDSRIGRRWNLEPLTAQFPELSPYVVLNNNPILNDDPNGAESKSIHVDAKGKVLKNINDGDNSVFVHKAGTTANDIDKKYTTAQHSAGGTKIGELGKSINVDGILKNVLQDHRSEMVNSQTPKLSWLENVLPGNRWDLKANEKTIFGVAWAFDKNSEIKTAFTFSYNNTLNLEFKNAADVGNFHAGYMGMYANISVAVQRMFAGGGEKAKNAVDRDGNNFWGNSVLVPPFADRKPDYFWNKMGMVAGDYDKKIKATINPKPRYNIPPTNIDAVRVKSALLPR